jgi:hypothetical protein
MRNLLIAASLLCTGAVHGEPLSSMGIGTATCVQFVTEYRADAGNEQRFFDWAQGLMSGINDALEDTMGKYRDLNSMPITQQKQILRAYCDDHPAATYRNGINALMNYLTIAPSELPPGYPLQQLDE